MTYEEALAEGGKLGTSKCSDAAAMALFCRDMLQILVGAVSPKLVWEGAQKTNLTLRDLMELCSDKPSAVDDLMWI